MGSLTQPEDTGVIRIPTTSPRRSPHVVDLRVAAPQRPAPPVQTARANPQPRAKRPRRKLTAKLLLVHALKVVVVLAAAYGFLSLDISLPERLIGIYFALALVYAIDSQRTFLVALVFLVMVAGWSAFGNSVSAENYAIYAFYFLVIGLVSAIREMVWKSPSA